MDNVVNFGLVVGVGGERGAKAGHDT